MTSKEQVLARYPEAELVQSVDAKGVDQYKVLFQLSPYYTSPTEEGAWNAALGAIHREDHQAEQKLLKVAALERVTAFFQANPTVTVAVSFCGGGDSGSVEEVETSDEAVELSDQLEDDFTELTYEALEPHDWYNGPGGSGTVTFSWEGGRLKSDSNIGFYVEEQRWHTEERDWSEVA